MKIAQFLCFSPDLAEEQITSLHVFPELPPCNRRRRWRRRWRRRLARIVFPILIRSQENGYTDASSTSKRYDQFCKRKPTSVSEASAVRKSDSDFDRGSDEAIFSPSSSSSPKTPSSSSPILPARRSKEAVEAATEKLSALCFLAVSLMVMVFCGRVCAILWTASGFCFLPRRKSAPEAAEFGRVTTAPVAAWKPPPAADLRQRGFRVCDRRRVVLEGFLGRR